MTYFVCKSALSKALALAALATPLGACTSFFGLPLAKASNNMRPPAQAVELADASPTPQFTNQGREQLTAGNPGLAAESFRRAMIEGEPAAPALNGLAIAYALTGREDLALRYFEQAVAAAPENANYRTNLARLILTSQSRRGDLAIALPGTVSVPGPAETPRKTIAAFGLLHRVSRGEVKLVTRSDPVVDRTASITIDHRFRPQVRLEIPDGHPRSASAGKAVENRMPPSVPVRPAEPVGGRSFVRLEMPKSANARE